MAPPCTSRSAPIKTTPRLDLREERFRVSGRLAFGGREGRRIDADHLGMGTGEVETVPGDGWDEMESLDLEGGRYRFIDRVESYAIHNLMEEFAEGRADPKLRRLLLVALDGKGAFGRFRRVLDDYPEERERWYAAKAEFLTRAARAWLLAKQISPLAEGVVLEVEG